MEAKRTHSQVPHALTQPEPAEASASCHPLLRDPFSLPTPGATAHPEEPQEAHQSHQNQPLSEEKHSGALGNYEKKINFSRLPGRDVPLFGSQRGMLSKPGFKIALSLNTFGKGGTDLSEDLFWLSRWWTV